MPNPSDFLNLDEFEDFSVYVRADQHRGSCVYDPIPILNNGPKVWTVNINAMLLPEALLRDCQLKLPTEFLPWWRTAMNSKKPIEVAPHDWRVLSDKLREFEVRNLPRNRVLEGFTLEVHLSGKRFGTIDNPFIRQHGYTPQTWKLTPTLVRIVR